MYVWYYSRDSRDMTSGRFIFWKIKGLDFNFLVFHKEPLGNTIILNKQIKWFQIFQEKQLKKKIVVTLMTIKKVLFLSEMSKQKNVTFVIFTNGP